MSAILFILQVIGAGAVVTTLAFSVFFVRERHRYARERQDARERLARP